MNLRDALAHNLRQKRGEREKTLDDFAEEIGISRSTLTAGTFCELVEALGEGEGRL